jgi:hypothetical protein
MLYIQGGKLGFSGLRLLPGNEAVLGVCSLLAREFFLFALPRGKALWQI